MHCGSPLRGAAPGTVPAANRAWGWWGAGIGALAAGLLAAILALSGVLGLGAGRPEPVLVARGSNETPPLLEKHGEAPPSLLADDTERIEMPADVRAWLEHLERIEKEKVVIHEDQAIEMMGMMGSIQQQVLGKIGDLADPDSDAVPAAKADEILPIEDLKKPWIELRRKFNDGPPVPEECRALRDRYDDALMQVPGAMADIVDIAGNLFDPEKGPRIRELRDLQRKHKQYIDEPMRQADREVGAICSKYRTRKWFSISPDVSLGGALGGFGGGGLGPGLGLGGF